MRKTSYFISRTSYFSQTGFTLIESLVVIAITVTLLGSLIVYSRGGESQVVFLKEQATLVGVFLQARSFALDAFQPTLQPSPGGSDELSVTERVCSWGVHVEPDALSGGTYILFRDLGDLTTGCAVANKQYDVGEAFQTFVVDKRLKLECVGLVPDESCQGSTPRDILFTPPTPKISFAPSAIATTNTTNFEVVLALADGSRTVTVSVTKGGSVNLK